METTGMTKQQKKAAIDAAWAQYRSESQALPRTLPYSGFKRGGVWREGWLETDQRLFSRYLSAERAINAAPEPSTKAA